MPTYTKLFNSIVTSTIWTEDDKTRIVWITMLAMADQHGEVHASIPGLARVSGVSVQDCEMAIGKLLSPDAYSRTPDNEGRRIAPIDGGWELLNHGKYRLMASKEDAKAATAERVRRHRERLKPVTPCNAPVTPCNAPVTVFMDIAEAEADTNLGTSTEEVNPNRTPESSPDEKSASGHPSFVWEFFDFWDEVMKPKRKTAVTSKRITALRARLKDPHFAENWRDAIRAIPQTPFLTGHNDRGWIADVDFILKPDSVVKITEGKYNSSTPKPQPEKSLQRNRTDGMSGADIGDF
jgi:hypothetical protein